MNRVMTDLTTRVRKRRLRGSAATMVAPAGDGAASRGPLRLPSVSYRTSLGPIRREAAVHSVPSGKDGQGLQTKDVRRKQEVAKAQEDT